jgi:hypothetical protein
MGYVILASGMYLAGLAFFLNTSNWQSGLLLRAVPGLIGFGLMINGAKHLGLI